MITLIINYKSYILITQLFNRLRCENINFWYMHKESKIRLRIYESDLFVVKSLLAEKKNQLTYTEVLYEPECNLFGGNQTTELVHLLLCKICLFVVIFKGLLPLEMCEMLCVKLLIEVIDTSVLDAFEKWDVWCKVSAQRRIVNKQGMQVVLNHIGDIYAMIENDMIFYSYINEHREYQRLFDDIKDIIAKIIDNQKKGISRRGARGILSSVIIFSFNMMGISAKTQALYAKSIEIINNPDFRSFTTYDD